MKAILFYPDSGNQCAEFQREAKAAAKFFGASQHPFRASADEATRRKDVLDVLRWNKGANLDLVAFLCHGFRDHLQCGFRAWHVKELAQAIAEACAPGASVPLYACSTGKGPGVDADGVGDATGVGEGGFADDLRDELVAHGMRGGTMLSHASAGHLSRNPETRIFSLEPGAVGGYDIAPVGKDRDLYRRWRGLLHTPNGRWEIATMPAAAIEDAARKCEPYSD